MKPQKQFVGIVAAIIAILTTNSCAFPVPIFDTRIRPAVSDDSLVTGEPCLPPCWYDIQPGSTDTTTALEKVRLLEFVNPTSVEKTFRDLYPGTDDSIDWEYQGTADFGGGIFILEDTVRWFRVDHPNYLVLEDIITTIGEPDWVWVGRAGGAGNHHIYRFVFEKMGLMLESRMYGDNSLMPESVILRSDIQINKAFYFTPRSLAEFLTEIRQVPEDELGRIMSDYQVWPGYGAEIRTPKDSILTDH